MSDDIFFDHGRNLAHADDLGTYTQRIRQIVQNLEGELTPLAHEWKSDSSDLYFHTVKPAWDQAVQDQATQLHNHGNVLVDNSNVYTRAMNLSAEGFQSIRF